MENTGLSILNIANQNTQFINDFKYKVHNHPKKYNLETAQEVEGLFVYILLKSMRNTLTKDDLLSNHQSQLYTEIYDQKIAQEISKKGIGLTKMILQQIQQTKSYNQ